MRHPRLPNELSIQKPSEAAFETEDAYVLLMSEHMREAYAIDRVHLNVSFD